MRRCQRRPDRLEIEVGPVTPLDFESARLEWRLRDLVKNGDVSANVEMKPGDVLIIPQSWF